MKQALELAREGVEIHNENSPEYKVCAALLAIAEAEKQEHVGFYDAENKDLRQEIPMGEDGDWWQPVYTHPQPKQEPLTDGQIWDEVQHGVIGSIGFPSKAIAVARAIEAAHGITSDMKQEPVAKTAKQRHEENT